MRTALISSLPTLFVCFGFAAPAARGQAPKAIQSLVIELKAVTATYDDDLDTFRLRLDESDFNGDTFSYQRISPDIGELKFSNWEKVNSETYSGTYTFEFSSDTEGKWREDYTGTYNGFIEGTFTIISMDVPIPPEADRQTVTIKKGKKTRLHLEGDGFDIRKGGLKYKIVKPPKIGKLIARKGSKVIYKPERGFKGSVKFKFIVIEGKARSKPATVTLKVR